MQNLPRSSQEECLPSSWLEANEILRVFIDWMAPGGQFTFLAP